LKSQRRLASKILKVGETRVWFDPERTDLVEEVITREEIRRLIHSGVIKAKPQTGVSRGRSRRLHEKKRKGLRRGPGSREGKKTARHARKRAWVTHIRGIRADLKALRGRRVIRETAYRRLYLLAKGGTFRDRDHLRQYIDTHRLARRR
jgi:large subunit ribosomal protein L19e